MRIHKHHTKMQHKPSKIDPTTGSCSPVASVCSAEMKCKLPSDAGNRENEFVFTDSPSLNDTFEHAAKVATLAEHFNLTKFKTFQKNVIDNTLSGKDSIIVQPTGSGKSLCYQFPPVYQNNKAIVVSPTISLMHDQVNNN